MAPVRPIGHIAGNLHILAISASYRLRQVPAGQTYACWVDDDGCVYLALADHQRAIAMLRHAPEQHVNSYRKPMNTTFPLVVADIVNELQEARIAQASRHMQQAHMEALHA